MQHSTVPNILLASGDIKQQQNERATQYVSHAWISEFHATPMPVRFVGMNQERGTERGSARRSSLKGRKKAIVC